MTETKTILLKDLLTIAKKKHHYPIGKGKHSPVKDTLPEITIEYLKHEKEKGRKLKDIAQELKVRPAYLSAHLTQQGIYWSEL